MTTVKELPNVFSSPTLVRTQVLADGHRRVWETGAVNRERDGTWTLVGFSLTDSLRTTRHDLRSQLVRAGFGLLQSALWVAPGAKDVSGILASLQPSDLRLDDHVTVLQARALKPTESADLVRKAFGTEQIAERYRAFLDRWDNPHPLPTAADDLAVGVPDSRPSMTSGVIRR
ncbi:hypothetical protein [Microbispora sp. NPDC046933]|uniref:hypothetical protein n=1 Tax=Microbispora sp. NPDC046933 TaxID=3155618 RepID=UPI0033C64F7F